MTTSARLAGRRTVTRQGVHQHRAALALERLVLVAVLGGATVVGLLSHSLLPEKFFRDEGHLLDYAASGAGAVGEGSYRTTAKLLDVVGFTSHPSLQVLVTLGLVFAMTVPSVWPRVDHRPDLMTLVLFAGTLTLSVIYLTQGTKELFVLPVTAAALFMPRRLIGEGVVLALMALFAVGIRPYWALVIVGYLVIRFLRSLRARSPLIPIAFAVVWELVLAGAIFLATGNHLAAYRNEIASQLSIERGSQIFDYIATTDLLSSWLDGILSLLLIVFPLPLLRSPSLTYYLFAAFLALLFLAFLRAWPLSARELGIGGERGLALLMSLVMVQATFEPDYGSVLRHLTALLPLAVAFAAGRHRARLAAVREEGSRGVLAGTGV